MTDFANWKIGSETPRAQELWHVWLYILLKLYCGHPATESLRKSVRARRKGLQMNYSYDHCCALQNYGKNPKTTAGREILYSFERTEREFIIGGGEERATCSGLARCTNAKSTNASRIPPRMAERAW